MFFGKEIIFVGFRNYHYQFTYLKQQGAAITLSYTLDSCESRVGELRRYAGVEAVIVNVYQFSPDGKISDPVERLIENLRRKASGKTFYDGPIILYVKGPAKVTRIGAGLWEAGNPDLFATRERIRHIDRLVDLDDLTGNVSFAAGVEWLQRCLRSVREFLPFPRIFTASAAVSEEE